jgi:histidine triad (HIT) family protein
MTEKCIFCQIAGGDIPARIEYQDEQVTVFHDQEPGAPVHLLIIPNQHIASLDEAGEAERALLGHIALTAKKLAEQMGIRQSGYRLITNTGPDARQTVLHLHFHLMGGKHLPGLDR